jgi:hypothetical protein
MLLEAMIAQGGSERSVVIWEGKYRRVVMSTARAAAWQRGLMLQDVCRNSTLSPGQTAESLLYLLRLLTPPEEKDNDDELGNSDSRAERDGLRVAFLARVSAALPSAIMMMEEVPASSPPYTASSLPYDMRVVEVLLDAGAVLPRLACSLPKVGRHMAVGRYMAWRRVRPLLMCLHQHGYLDSSRGGEGGGGDVFSGAMAAVFCNTDLVRVLCEYL